MVPETKVLAIASHVGLSPCIIIPFKDPWTNWIGCWFRMFGWCEGFLWVCFNLSHIMSCCVVLFVLGCIVLSFFLDVLWHAYYTTTFHGLIAVIPRTYCLSCLFGNIGFSRLEGLYRCLLGFWVFQCRFLWWETKMTGGWIVIYISACPSWLSLSTEVFLTTFVDSYVGNTMATFVMQTLGCEVAAINTVHFSTHFPSFPYSLLECLVRFQSLPLL